MTTTTTHQDLGRAFNEGRRPPLTALPAVLAELILERDRIRLQVHTARSVVSDLTGDHLDQQAQAADDDTAEKAARAGKAIPKASNLTKLTTAREEADRNLAAQQAALDAVTNDALNAASDAYPWDDRAAIRAATKARIAEAANALGDLVEAAYLQEVTIDWLRTSTYDRVAMIDAATVFDLSRLNANEHNLPAASVRDAIVKAAIAPFTEQEN